MKHFIYLFIGLLLLPVLGRSQDSVYLSQESLALRLHFYHACDHELDPRHFLKRDARLQSFLEREQQRYSKSKNKEYYLYRLFYKVHNRFLVSYQEMTHFHELLDRGQYDCLTGTILFGIILDELGIDYYVRESKYHMYLLVAAEGKDYIFEVTDPFNGFVADPVEIARREDQFKEYDPTKPDTNEAFYEFKTRVFNQVGMPQLKGLYYYNLAVESFNLRQFHNSNFYMQQGLEYYRSNRMHEFYSLVKRETHRFKLTSSSN